jgi:hypothetical protein
LLSGTAGVSIKSELRSRRKFYSSMFELYCHSAFRQWHFVFNNIHRKKKLFIRIPHYRTEPKLHQAFPTAKKIQQKNDIISVLHTKNLVLESSLLRSIGICGFRFVRIAMNLVRKTDYAGMTVSTRTAASEGITDSTGIIPSWE